MNSNKQITMVITNREGDIIGGSGKGRFCLNNMYYLDFFPLWFRNWKPPGQTVKEM